jgi:hypothetical protein
MLSSSSRFQAVVSCMSSRARVVRALCTSGYAAVGQITSSAWTGPSSHWNYATPCSHLQATTCLGWSIVCGPRLLHAVRSERSWSTVLRSHLGASCRSLHGWSTHGVGCPGRIRLSCPDVGQLALDISSCYSNSAADGYRCGSNQHGGRTLCSLGPASRAAPPPSPLPLIFIFFVSCSRHASGSL